MWRALLLCLAVVACLPLASLDAFAVELTDPRIVISGQVVDSDKVPVSDARVHAASRTTAVTAHTDRSGRFTVALPLTYCGVSITANAADRVGMVWLPIDSSLLEPRTVSILLSPLVPLEVTVTDGDGRPVAGARVGADINGVGLSAVESDTLGKATLRIPRRPNQRLVYAYKAGRGFDFHTLESARTTASVAEHAIGKLTLKLAPSGKKVTVRAETDDGMPVAGLLLRPFQLYKRHEFFTVGLSAMPGIYSATTDAEGIAHFDDLPASMERLAFSILDDRTALRRFDWNSRKNPDPIIDIAIPRAVKMSGRVRFVDGGAAPEIVVEALGSGGPKMSPCYSRAISRRDGAFAINVQPDQTYRVLIDDRKWAAGALEGIVVSRGKPIDNLTLTLRHPTQVSGRVALGRAHRPMVDQEVVLEENSQQQMRFESASRRYDPPFRSRSVTTDRSGEYRFEVGPGRYTVRGPLSSGRKQFSVSNQSEVIFDFAVTRPATGPVSLAVVDAASGRPVPHATISGLGNARRTEEPEVSTDESGLFHGQRSLTRTLLVALSPNKRLAGLLEIGPDESAATIQLQPVGRAVAKVVNSTTHAPFANAVIHYTACAPLPAGCSGNVVTDEQGNLKLDSLIPAVKYDLQAGKSWVHMGVVGVAASEVKQLGTLIVDERSKLPSVQLEIAESLASDPLRDYLAARERARLFRQQVIVFLIDPNSAQSCALMKSVLQPPRVYATLRELYRCVIVDATSEPGKALAQSLKVPIDIGALPQIVVRDTQGAPVVSRDLGGASANEEFNEANLVDFLRRHAGEPLDARKLLEGGLAQARKSNRRVLLVHASPNYDDCYRIVRYLDSTRSIWQKEFILVRIDNRWMHSQEVLEETALVDRVGDPWLAILDTRGKVKMSFNDGQTEHLLTLFRENSQRLSDDDLWDLRIGFDAVPLDSLGQKR
jgi:hypothetical protein